MKNLNKLLIILIPVVFMTTGLIAQEVLYDNGPIVTAVGVGSNNSNYSEVQVNLGLGATGESMNINGPVPVSVADDFVVDETWIINSFTFYGYQTGEGPPSTLYDIKVQIWDDNPMLEPTASVIWGDITAATGPNLIVTTEWTNCWRVQNNNIKENRPIMNIVANTAGLVLEPGTYWVEYTCAGTGSSGPWANMVSIIGQAETGNSIQKQSAWQTNADQGYGQGLPFIIRGTTGSLLTNDLALIAIPTPTTDMNLLEETVAVKILNMGTASQTGFDVSYTINGGQAVTETVSATIGSNETYDYTFNTPVDLSEVGIYNFEACVILADDENPDNDCTIKEVENIEIDYCNANTTYSSEHISRMVFGAIENTSGWQAGISNYTDLYTSIGAGLSQDITITNGVPRASDAVTVWVDWNDDYVFELGGDEEYFLTNSGTGALFTGKISVPANAADGMHRMRVRLVRNEVPMPCGNSNYGEIEEYTILVEDPTYGDLEGTVTEVNGGAPIEGATITVDEYTTTTGADGYYSFTDLISGNKTVSCTIETYNEKYGTVLIEEGVTATLDFELDAISYGNLEGTVTDGSTAIEGATVTVAGMTTKTNAEGLYSFTDIEVGSYDVTCVAIGYSFEYQEFISIEEGITTVIDFVLEATGTIPTNFTANVIDVTDVLLEWNPPAGALMELSQHDNDAKYHYFEFFNNVYGVVFDLSEFPGATLEMADFYHVSAGNTGVWDYKIHIVDWETRTELIELGPFKTTVNDDWEQDIYLGSYPAGISGVIGILIEPLGNTPTDAYPSLAFDEELNGSSVLGPIVDYSACALAAGDFLLDLWVISPNGKEMIKANKASIGYPTSEKAVNDYAPIVESGITRNKNASRFNEFIGYNLYRDDELIAENLYLTHFLDADLASGTYTYDVKAVYSDGLSESAGPLTVTVGSGIPRDLVIIEVGTGTWCVFCPGAAMGVDQMHEEGLSVGIIEYHDDDIYANSESGLRLGYYSISGFPTAKFDGLDESSGGSATNSLYQSYLPKYESRIGVPSLFALTSTYKNVGGENYQITVDAEMIETYAGLNHDIVLQVALTESHIEESWQNQSELNFVLRDLIPDQNGTQLEFASSAKQSIVLDYSIPSSYNMENVEIIVFIQDNATKEILQGTKSIFSTTGINNNTLYESGITIYPNPFKDYANVSFKLDNAEYVEVTVYNIIGKVVFYSEQNLSPGQQELIINTQGFNSGIHLVNLKAGNKVYTKKLFSY